MHCAHHKVGTLWFKTIFTEIAGRYGLRFDVCRDGRPARRTDMVLYPNATQFHPGEFGSRLVRGTHMIRDPRDVVISGFFYHLWTDERWAHEPRPEFGGKSYQQLLRSLTKDDGLLAEIRRAAMTTIPDMASWRYDRPGFMELRYEDVIADEAEWFGRIFRHYGFDDPAVERCLHIVHRHSFQGATGRAVGTVREHKHRRSGKVGEWREHFREEHRALFKQLAGESLLTLGYEESWNW